VKPNTVALRSSLSGRTGAGDDKAGNQYRDLAQDCQRIANSLPAGSETRTSLLEMAQIWERLADEQERATDLRKKG
jgi:hypothetical protein